MSILTMKVKSDPSTLIQVSDVTGNIDICNGAGDVIRIVDAAQARDIAQTLERAADHAQGKLIAGGV